MANETGLEGVRERAREFASSLSSYRMTSPTSSRPQTISEMALTIADALKSEREAEMELCCKDVCVGCAQEIPFDGQWHRLANGGFFICRALAIRERWAGKREGR
jgi:hypothetical protein